MIVLGPFPLRAYAVFIILGAVVAVVIGDRRWVARGGQSGTVADVATVFHTAVPREIRVAAGTLTPRAEEFTAGGRDELGLDLDFFLASLMDEYAAGHAPVNPMSAPRRVDGTRYRKHVSLRR